MDAPITRPLLQAIAQRNALTPNAIDIAFTVSGLRPSPQQSLAFGLQALKLAGTLSIAAGIIFFVASNWQYFPPLTRFAIVEVPLLAALVFAFFQGTQKLSGKLATFFAILNTGALLALMGQTYQSGADVYQLFTYWALLSMPLAIAARYAPTWALWLVVANAGAALYSYRDLLPFYFSLAAYALSEGLHRYPKLLPNTGLEASWLRRSVLTLSVLAGTGLMIELSMGSIEMFSSSKIGFQAVSFLFLCALLAAYTYHRKQDSFPLALLSLCFIAISTTFFLYHLLLDLFMALIFYTAYILGTSTAAAKMLNALGNQWQHQQPPSQ